MTQRHISNGSAGNVCTLHLNKAFDRINHSALLIKLMLMNLPVQLLTFSEFWLSVSVMCVNWKGHFSEFYSLTAGALQGGVSFRFWLLAILAFFLLIRYSFALQNFCRILLHQKIVYVYCLLVTRASSCMAYSCNSGKIFKLNCMSVTQCHL